MLTVNEEHLRRILTEYLAHQWVISTEPTHPALVSEADFITVQNMRADRAAARHDYRLKGLLRCAVCDRKPSESSKATKR